jgi:hypothetical protein
MLSLAAVAACCPAASVASTRQFTSFEAPAELLNAGDAARTRTLNELQSLGVDSIRMNVFWETVAPDPNARHRPSGFDATNPAAYDWGAYGRLADDVHARGMRLLIAVSGPVPRWVTPHAVDHLTDPSPGEYKSLMTAIGRRFGRQAYAFSIWNEPNLAKFLEPQFDRRGRALSPALYRSLFFAPVLAGETAPVGNFITVAPTRFLRGVLCLDGHYRRNARCSRLPAAGWSTHPYMRPVFPTSAPPKPDDITIGGLGRLARALDRAADAGMVARGLPIYASEFGVQSYPNRVAGLPLALQSDYRSVSEYLAYNNQRVASFSQYLLTDPAPLSGSGFSRYVFQMGLYLFAPHHVKPAYDSFRLPLVVKRSGGSVALWGLVRPARAAHASGSVSVQYSDPGTHGWRPLLQARFGSSGYWTGRGSYRSGRQWRVRWSNGAGQTFTGAATAAYAF